jgi:L-cysteine S-thiosulfotransferase
MKACHAIVLALLLFSSSSLAGEIPDGERRSGYGFMGPDTRAMQDDDTSNPGMLFVLDGETLWNKKPGATDKSCADCHGDARDSMKGVAARYPAFDKPLGRPVTLFAYESRDLLALSAFVANQSRGMPITTGDDTELKPFIEKGRALFMQREGQFNLACTNCHDDNFDKHLAGSPVTQGQPNGYPEYRLEWQTLGSLERRLRSCITGVRAQAPDYGAPELVALELYLMSRAHGMKMETPAVRP